MLRPKPKIKIFVRRYNRIYRRKVSEYWGSTDRHDTCASAASTVKRGVPGPEGVTAHYGERVFARFDRR